MLNTEQALARLHAIAEPVEQEGPEADLARLVELEGLVREMTSRQ